jgi:hypothetical protein
MILVLLGFFGGAIVSAHSMPAPECSPLTRVEGIPPSLSLKNVGATNRPPATDVASGAMVQILQVADSAIAEAGNKGTDCQNAAANIAFQAVFDAYTGGILGGFLRAIKSALTNIFGLGKEGLEEYLGGKLDEAEEAAREAFKEWVKEKLKGKPPEVFEKAFTKGPCTGTVTSTWDMSAGTYKVVVKGECACNPVSTGGLRSAQLKEFTVTVTGKVSIDLDYKEHMPILHVDPNPKVTVEADCESCSQPKTMKKPEQPVTPPPPGTTGAGGGTVSQPPPVPELPKECDIKPPCPECMAIYNEIVAACNKAKALISELRDLAGQWGGLQNRIAYAQQQLDQLNAQHAPESQIAAQKAELTELQQEAKNLILTALNDGIELQKLQAALAELAKQLADCNKPPCGPKTVPQQPPTGSTPPPEKPSKPTTPQSPQGGSGATPPQGPTVPPAPPIPPRIPPEQPPSRAIVPREPLPSCWPVGTDVKAACQKWLNIAQLNQLAANLAAEALTSAEYELSVFTKAAQDWADHAKSLQKASDEYRTMSQSDAAKAATAPNPQSAAQWQQFSQDAAKQSETLAGQAGQAQVQADALTAQAKAWADKVGAAKADLAAKQSAAAASMQDYDACLKLPGCPQPGQTVPIQPTGPSLTNPLTPPPTTTTTPAPATGKANPTSTTTSTTPAQKTPSGQNAPADRFSLNFSLRFRFDFDRPQKTLDYSCTFGLPQTPRAATRKPPLRITCTDPSHPSDSFSAYTIAYDPIFYNILINQSNSSVVIDSSCNKQANGSAACTIRIPSRHKELLRGFQFISQYSWDKALRDVSELPGNSFYEYSVSSESTDTPAGTEFHVNLFPIPTGTPAPPSAKPTFAGITFPGAPFSSLFVSGQDCFQYDPASNTFRYFPCTVSPALETPVILVPQNGPADSPRIPVTLTQYFSTGDGSGEFRSFPLQPFGTYQAKIAPSLGDPNQTQFTFIPGASSAASSTPNGSWKLYIQDEACGADPGRSLSGWCLNFTENPVSRYSVSSDNPGPNTPETPNPFISNLPGTVPSVTVTVPNFNPPNSDSSFLLVGPGGTSSNLNFFSVTEAGSGAPADQGPQPHALEGFNIKLSLEPGMQQAPTKKNSALKHHQGDAEVSKKRATGHVELASFHSVNGLDMIPPGTLVRIVPRAPSHAKPRAQQAAQAAVPIAFSFVANGNASGEAFELLVANPSGQLQEIRAPDGLILEPVARGSAKPVSPAPGQKLSSHKLNAYCVKYDKDPPDPDAIYRVAAPQIQEQYKPIRFVIRAGRELAAAGKFHPDSDPAAYILSIRQYALWTKLENWNEQQFADVFVEKTHRIAAESKVEWNKDMEQAIRALVPGRWRDISLVIDEARKLEAAAPAPPAR